MADSVFTPAASRHVRRLVRALTPAAKPLERCFRALLCERRYDAAGIKALLAITPVAAARLRSVRQFLEQVEYNGRRLAKLNLGLAEVKELLEEFGGLLDSPLEGRFEPAREQLQLATILALNEAYYQVREEESQALFGLYRADAGAADFEDLLRRLVRVLVRTFHARSGRIFLLDKPADGTLSRPLYIERGEPGERLISDPRMRGHYRSYWSYPLCPEALLQLAFPISYPWLPRELALLDAAAGRCREAIGRARMQREVRRLGAQARQAEEQERQRIGRELHDDAGQSLLLLRLQLEMIERDAPAPLRKRLSEARAIAERTVGELRRTIASLSPEVLERLGLGPAVRHLAARFSKAHAATVSLRIAGPCEGLPMSYREVIYRVAQESLQNISKHSQATHVILSLRAADNSIKLRVTDNGAGFSAETAWRKPMSFGLVGMRKRAALLGGTLVVTSAPGKGATVILQLPPASAQVATHVKDSRSVN